MKVCNLAASKGGRLSLILQNGKNHIFILLVNLAGIYPSYSFKKYLKLLVLNILGVMNSFETLIVMDPYLNAAVVTMTSCEPRVTGQYRQRHRPPITESAHLK